MERIDREGTVVGDGRLRAIARPQMRAAAKLRNVPNLETAFSAILLAWSPIVGFVEKAPCAQHGVLPPGNRCQPRQFGRANRTGCGSHNKPLASCNHFSRLSFGRRWESAERGADMSVAARISGFCGREMPESKPASRCILRRYGSLDPYRKGAGEFVQRIFTPYELPLSKLGKPDGIQEGSYPVGDN